MRRALGFTLVELLVTLSIMTVIMGVALVAFSSTRATGRDGRRRADIEALRSALEIYRNDNGYYPLTLAGLTPTYISTTPADPASPSRNYAYAPSPAGCSNSGANRCVGYSLCAALEIGGSAVTGCGSCAVACNYKTTNP